VLDPAGNGACEIDDIFFANLGSADTATVQAESVTVEQELSVGPFKIQIVSSDNANEMADWLDENGYDLSDRGMSLLEPYVNDGMKFVAVKLRDRQTTGSIQPLIMQYQSDKPTVPIKLTAVAALEDMGVVVWLVSDARGVPDNYLHVVPNYTQLNWYTGPNNAYGSYQALITNAMNEAGGQGFATDFAGPVDNDIIDFLSNAENLDQSLSRYDSFTNDADFLTALYGGSRTEALRAAFTRLLPLPAGQNERIYFEQLALASVYTDEELSNAREELRQAFIDIEIEPLRSSTELLPEGRYLTRLYTTMSADEMTLDPSFVFNPDMEDQSRLRRATLEENCVNDKTEWSLTLGEGTGRNGETVLSGTNESPITIPLPITTQSAVYSTAITSADAEPDFRVVNLFESVSTDEAEEIDGESEMVVSSGSSAFLGSTSFWWLCLSVLLFRTRCSRDQL